MENFNIEIPALEQFRNMCKYEQPVFYDLTDRKNEMLSDLRYEIKEINNNTKKRTWRDIFLVILTAIISSLFNFLLNIIF